MVLLSSYLFNKLTSNSKIYNIQIVMKIRGQNYHEIFKSLHSSYNIIFITLQVKNLKSISKNKKSWKVLKLFFIIFIFESKTQKIGLNFEMNSFKTHMFFNSCFSKLL